MSHLEDHELIKKFSATETRNYAFNLIVRKYQERIYWHIRKMVYNHDDADDITQDTFIKAYKGLLKFREDSQLYTWIYRIATNECLNFIKKNKRRNLISLNEVENIIEAQFTDDNELSGREIQIALQMAIAQLPEKQKLVFNMKYFDDMKYEDMSAVLKTSVGALKASYHLAVKKIETILNPD